MLPACNLPMNGLQCYTLSPQKYIEYLKTIEILKNFKQKGVIVLLESLVIANYFFCT